MVGVIVANHHISSTRKFNFCEGGSFDIILSRERQQNYMLLIGFGSRVRSRLTNTKALISPANRSFYDSVSQKVAQIGIIITKKRNESCLVLS
ncbi:hypothetical protein L1887_16414 [Cichorium endivia]|nr:hypothetical protein L1887_16414 [Cichorium endivia]